MDVEGEPPVQCGSAAADALGGCSDPLPGGSDAAAGAVMTAGAAAGAAAAAAAAEGAGPGAAAAMAGHEPEAAAAMEVNAGTGADLSRMQRRGLLHGFYTAKMHCSEASTTGYFVCHSRLCPWWIPRPLSRCGLRSAATRTGCTFMPPPTAAGRCSCRCPSRPSLGPRCVAAGPVGQPLAWHDGERALCMQVQLQKLSSCAVSDHRLGGLPEVQDSPLIEEVLEAVEGMRRQAADVLAATAGGAVPAGSAPDSGQAAAAPAGGAPLDDASHAAAAAAPAGGPAACAGIVVPGIGPIAIDPGLGSATLRGLIAEARAFAAEWRELRAVHQSRLSGRVLQAPLVQARLWAGAKKLSCTPCTPCSAGIQRATIAAKRRGPHHPSAPLCRLWSWCRRRQRHPAPMAPRPRALWTPSAPTSSCPRAPSGGRCASSSQSEWGCSQAARRLQMSLSWAGASRLGFGGRGVE